MNGLKFPTKDLVLYPRKRGIASVDFLLLEALINKAGVIPKVADPVVAREVEVTLHCDHPTPVIFIECAYTVTQFLLEAIAHVRDNAIPKVVVWRHAVRKKLPVIDGKRVER